jgi:hypothetical protein
VNPKVKIDSIGGIKRGRPVNDGSDEESDDDDKEEEEEGTLIEIIPPSESPDMFRCRKGWPAINVIAICDHKMRFTYISTGQPGASNDSGTPQDTDLYEAAENLDTRHLWFPNNTYLLGTPGSLSLIGFCQHSRNMSFSMKITSVSTRRMRRLGKLWSVHLENRRVNGAS